VGQPFARYSHDPSRAAALFAEGGWLPNASGALVGSDGRQVHIETRAGNQTWVTEVALVADFWRRAGIDAQELVPSPARSRDNEFSATFPGVVIRARGANDSLLVAFDSRLQASQRTRWRGSNVAHYASPRLDALIDRIETTMPVPENAQALREVGLLFQEDLPALPLYFRTAFAAGRNTVQALTDDYQGHIGHGDMARHAHLWEMR
jgi:peptide/nickel transport system substrate-binding protein